MGIVIKVENLGKKYIISHQQERYTALRDVMADTAKKAIKKVIGKGEALPKKEEFWALRNIDFEVNAGDRIGIIGRNGAGKSTLLKLLSRITEPTEGKIKIKGKIASLLEVGTGFHNELTGKENIFLNGAVLGMSKKEILKKMDDIVEFSGVEKFLDTPVKRYSSGMYVRLAFAVAANLETEILLVDEVLAVGDAEFQKKCLGKMEDVSNKEGRTILFVSHNMNAIERLCDSCLLLNKGSLIENSKNVNFVIKKYLYNDQESNLGKDIWINSGKDYDNNWFEPLKFYFSNSKNHLLSMPLSNSDDLWINIIGELKNLDPALCIGYAIYSSDGVILYWSLQTDTSQEKWPKLKKGICHLRSRIPKRFLNEDIYIVELIGSLHYRQWLFEPGKNSPQIVLDIKGGLSDSPHWIAKRPGVIAPIFKWEAVSGENDTI